MSAPTPGGSSSGGSPTGAPHASEPLWAAWRAAGPSFSSVRGGYLLALALAGQQPTRWHPFRSLAELERYIAQGQVRGVQHFEWWNADVEDGA